MSKKEIKFDRGHVLSYATSVNRDNDMVYFPTDSAAIVMGGKEYGCTSAVTSTLNSLSSQITSATAAASRAEAAAQDAASSLSDLRTAIQNLPDGQAVTAQVGLLKINKVEIIDVKTITATSPNNTIKDSFGNTIDAGKCKFVYSIDFSSDGQIETRYYPADTTYLNYNSTKLTAVKFKTSEDQSPYYTYWVFGGGSYGIENYKCIGVYNENTVPSYIRDAFTADVVETLKTQKIDKAYEIFDLGSQSNFTSTDTSNPLIGYYTFNKTGYTTSGIYNKLNSIWTNNVIPVITVTLENHTHSYAISLYKTVSNIFEGSVKAENGSFTIRLKITSSQCQAYIETVGTYTKPYAGIPKKDLATAVSTLIDGAAQVGELVDTVDDGE